MRGPRGAQELGSDDLQSIIEMSPVATVMVNLEQHVVCIANDAFAELVGHARHDVIGMRPTDILDAADGTPADNALTSLSEGVVDSYRARRLLRRGRERVPVTVSVRRLEVEKSAVAVAIVVPETESRVAGRAVGAFFGPEPLSLAVGTLNEHGQIDRVTPGSDLILGLDETDLFGVELSSLVHPDDIGLLSDSVRNTTERIEGTFVLLRLRHRANGWVDTRCLLCPISNRQNTAVVFVLAQPISDGPLGTYGDRIAILERHLLRFAEELHSAGWRNDAPPTIEPVRRAALDELPARQREVVDRLLQGERIPTIAAAMYISKSTARNHLSHAFRVFGVHSQSELLAHLRSAWVELESDGGDGRD